MGRFFIILSLLTFVSCGSDATNEASNKPIVTNEAGTDGLDSVKSSVESQVDERMLDKHHQKEFYENLKKIESQYGVQWDFCTCVVKNDSINKAISKLVSNPKYSETELDGLIIRSDTIEKRCKSFISQDLSQTPTQREEHEAKIRKCLKEAGIKD